MKTEKIFKREDGTQIQISINCFILNYSADNGMNYTTSISRREKGKKKWLSIYNPDDYAWRSLSMEDREKHNRQLELKYVTIEEIQSVALELWEKMKPNFI